MQVFSSIYAFKPLRYCLFSGLALAWSLTAVACVTKTDLCDSLDLSPSCQPESFILQFIGSDTFASHVFITTTGVDGFTVDQSTGVLTAMSGNPFGSGCVQRSIISPDKKRIYYNDSSTLKSLNIDNPDAPTATGLSVASLSANDMIFSEGGEHMFGNQGGPVFSMTYDTTNDTLTAVSGSPFGSGCHATFQTFGNFLVSGSIDLGAKPVTSFSYNSNDGSLTQVSTLLDQRLQYSVRHPYLNIMYLTGGLNSLENIFAVTVDATTGSLASLSGSPYALDASAQNAYVLDIHPKGTYLYVFAGDNSIRVFQINSDGTLTQLTSLANSIGFAVRHMKVDPSGKYLYTSLATGNEIRVFSIGDNGSLTQVSSNTATSSSLPQWIQLYTETIPW